MTTIATSSYTITTFKADVTTLPRYRQLAARMWRPSIKRVRHAANRRAGLRFLDDFKVALSRQTSRHRRRSVQRCSCAVSSADLFASVKRSVSALQLVRADFRQLSTCRRVSAFARSCVLFMNAAPLHPRRSERFLSEVRRLLHPDGLFAFDVVNPDPLWLAKSGGESVCRRRAFKHPCHRRALPLQHQPRLRPREPSAVSFVSFMSPIWKRSPELGRDHGPQKQPSSRLGHSFDPGTALSSRTRVLQFATASQVWHPFRGFTTVINPVSARARRSRSRAMKTPSESPKNAKFAIQTGKNGYLRR